LGLGGDMGHGLLSEDMWEAVFPYKSPLTGQTAAEFPKNWWRPTASIPTAPTVLTCHLRSHRRRVHRAKSVDREKVRKAMAATDLDTMYGHVKHDEQNVAEMPVVTSQWVKGEMGNEARTSSPWVRSGDFHFGQALFFLPARNDDAFVRCA
jgi:branched-chain amino acid transport system substrate-binding protein